MMLSIDLSQWKRPDPYEPGESQFWTDLYISTQMLQAHLDPNTDAASCRPERIDAVCAFLKERLGLAPGSAVVDLGCGPGLYSRRLASLGCDVTGIDFSKNSIEYAADQARGMANAPKYRLGNYLDWSERQQYDVALLIYEDFGVLASADRQKLLANIHVALRPGGLFALDAAGLAVFHALQKQPARDWEHHGGRGFWRPGEHLVLRERFLYPAIPAACEQYAVADGRATIVYRIHQTYYAPQSIAGELERAGFVVEEAYSSLAGEPWKEDSAQVAVICRKM